MKPQRPYLFDAIYRWVLDSESTPHLLVDANDDLVEVPRHLVSDGQIVLNLSPSAIANFSSDDSLIFFSARFSGKQENIVVPYRAMIALFSKETAQGLVFPLELESTSSSDTESNSLADPAIKPESKTKPELKAGSELKKKPKAKHNFRIVK